MGYVYLVRSSQAQARSTVVGNLAPAVDARRAVDKYQGVLEHALSKVDFSVGVAIYMPPRNLNLAVEKKEGSNNKVLVSNTGIKIGSNKDINWDHKKFPAVKPNVA